MFGFKSYNHQNFTRELLLADLAKLKQDGGPKPGEGAPQFEARTLEGDKVRLRDFEGEKDVVLTFGSATCPFTAASIRGLNKLHEEFEGKDVEFFFIYVREAHPGDRLPAHQSMKDKVRAAELLLEEEEVEIPILLDDLEGSVHKKYGKLPNATFIVDRTGRVAFRQLWTRPKALREALERLVELREGGNEDHVVLGDDKTMPVLHGILHSHRALERGGPKAVDEYREVLGVPGRLGHAASRLAEPAVLHPVRTLTAAALAAGVVAGGLYLGLKLRRERRDSREPYRRYRVPRGREEGDDYAVGI